MTVKAFEERIEIHYNRRKATLLPITMKEAEDLVLWIELLKVRSDLTPAKALEKFRNRKNNAELKEELLDDSYALAIEDIKA